MSAPAGASVDQNAVQPQHISEPSNLKKTKWCRTSDATFCSVEGFNPTWNENFQFEVYVPELALVRFVVEDYDSMSDNEFIGQYTLPFNSLKMGKLCSSTLQPRHTTMGSSLTVTSPSLPSGYRHVPLLNKNGDVLPSAGLFVHIMVLDPKWDVHTRLGLGPQLHSKVLAGFKSFIPFFSRLAF